MQKKNYFCNTYKIETMEKVNVLNIKTGKISEIPRVTYEMLMKNGKRKEFDLIEKSKPAKSKPAPKSIPKVDTNNDGKRSANEVIEAIEKADSKEAIDVLIDGESRKTVLKAAQKRKSEL